MRSVGFGMALKSDEKALEVNGFSLATVHRPKETSLPEELLKNFFGWAENLGLENYLLVTTFSFDVGFLKSHSERHTP
ncbi:MAG: hypothetical protein KatS3mg001_547 [Candidatus Pacearchaeota archaeon]|nr:MAG: hypothetical protein KatS3mg001_547 [Candidatus Pacearchaeota archaeon]